MRAFSPRRKLGASLLIAGLCLSCGPKNMLEPAKSANHVPGKDDAIRAEDQGVQLTAMADAWDGRKDVLSEVTPLRVVIRNDGSEPVQVRYKNFSLVAKDGTRYVALPPMQIQGTVEARASNVTPRWAATGYELAPYYHGVYGEYTPITAGPFAYDYDYYDAYYPEWINMELPTPEMLQRALPEGTLKPGGQVDGFVYFEKVGSNADQVALKASFVDPQSNNTEAKLSLPFKVED
jgi:hypothetical protein